MFGCSPRLACLGLWSRPISNHKYRVDDTEERLEYDLASELGEEDVVSEEDVQRLLGD